MKSKDLISYNILYTHLLLYCKNEQMYYIINVEVIKIFKKSTVLNVISTYVKRL